MHKDSTCQRQIKTMKMQLNILEATTGRRNKISFGLLFFFFSKGNLKNIPKADKLISPVCRLSMDGMIIMMIIMKMMMTMKREMWNRFFFI